MAKHPKRPRDFSQAAKLVVDIASGEVEDRLKKPTIMRAQRAGKKGGPARARVLTPEERSQIARVAAAARWKKSGN
jgi:hypothetical protein